MAHSDSPATQFREAEADHSANANAWTLVGMLALGVAYSTLVVPDYLLIDSLMALDDVYRGTVGAAEWTLALGRPLIAATMYWLFDSFNTIADIKYLRMLTLAATTGVFAIFYRGLFLRFMGPWEAFCLALTLCLLPPFVMATYYSILTVLPLGCIFAGITMLALQRSLSDPVPETGSVVRRFITFRRKSFGVAVLFAFVAVFTYQNSLFIATLLPLLYILRPSQPNDLMTTLRAMIVTVAAMLAGSVLQLLVWVPYRYLYFSHLRQGDRYFMDSFEEIAAKAQWFVFDALPAAANLFMANKPTWPAMIVLVLCLGQFLLLRTSWRDRALRALLWVALLPVSYTPNMFVAENYAAYRTFVGLQSYLLVSAALGGLHLWSVLVARMDVARTGIAVRNGVIITATAAMLLHQLLVVGPQSTRPRIEELALARDAVVHLRGSDEIERVVVVLADQTLNIGDTSLKGNMLIPSASRSWSVIPLFRVAYVEMQREMPPFEIIKMDLETFSSFVPLPGDHVINFDELLGQRFERLGQPLPHRN